MIFQNFFKCLEKIEIFQTLPKTDGRSIIFGVFFGGGLNNSGGGGAGKSEVNFGEITGAIGGGGGGSAV